MSATPSGIQLIVDSVVSETKLDNRDTGKIKILIKKRPNDPNTYDAVTGITPTLRPVRTPSDLGDNNYKFNPSSLDLAQLQIDDLNSGDSVELVFDLRTSEDFDNPNMLPGDYHVNLVMNVSSHANISTDTSIPAGAIISAQTFEIHEPDQE